jgi:branched-subunit amino acid aminotransferase/4-amino-4-deoxychorismate lyase
VDKEIRNILNYNGNIIPANQPIFTADNRAFKYGDSLFETIRVFNGKMPFLSYHFDRLNEGMKLLEMTSPSLPEGETRRSHFCNEINKLTNKKGNYRIRLTIFRSDGGLYTPKDNSIQFLIEKTHLGSSSFTLNDKGLSLGISENKLLSGNPISHLKTGNSLAYILAALEKEKNNYDDVLIQNNKGQIAEALSANLFLIMQNEIITPPLKSGCVGGTMRRFLVENNKASFKEQIITKDKLIAAQGAFLTNAIQGIKWIKKINDIEYRKPAIIDDLIGQLNEFIQE